MANSFVISALKSKRSELSGQIEDLDSKLGQARADLIHIDSSLRIFGFDQDPNGLPKKKVRKSHMFGRGQLQKILLDDLRISPDGLLVSEMVARLIATKQWNPEDSVLFHNITHRVGNSMNRLKRRGVVEHGELKGIARVWKLVM